MKGVFCFQWLTTNLTNSFLLCEEERNWFHCLIGCVGFKFWNNSVPDPLLVLSAFLIEWSRYTSNTKSILLEFPPRLRTVYKSISDISPNVFPDVFIFRTSTIPSNTVVVSSSICFSRSTPFFKICSNFDLHVFAALSYSRTMTTDMALSDTQTLPLKVTSAKKW